MLVSKKRAKQQNKKDDDFLAGSPRPVRFVAHTLLVLFLISILAGLANPPLYWMFLSDRGVGFFDTVGWDLYWEFHTGLIGGTLLALEIAPYVLVFPALWWMTWWYR